MRRAILIIAFLLVWSPAFAAFPSVAGHCESTDTIVDTSHNLDLDCEGGMGAIVAGDRLVIFMHGSANDATPNSALSGYALCREVVQGSSTGHLAVFEKIAAGGESTTPIASTDLPERVSAIALRITGTHASTAAECSTGRKDDSGGEAGNSPNPDALTPAWGAADTLFIAGAGSEGATTDFTVWPTNYGSNNYETANSGEGRVAVGTRDLNATSDDPGVFTTINSGLRWAAVTVGIRPAADGGGSARPCCLGVF